MTRVRSQWLLVGLSVAAAAGCGAELAATTNPACPPDPPPAAAGTGAPYRLNRTVYRIEIGPHMPVVRTRCWVVARDTPGGLDAGLEAGSAAPPDSVVVEWDPTSKAPPVRHVALRGAGTSKVDLACSSEQSDVGKNNDAKTISYVFEASSTACALPDAGVGARALIGRMTHVGGADAGALLTTDAGKGATPLCALGPFDTFVTLTRNNAIDPDLGGVDAELSRNRSLDPLTPIATELLAVVAEVAIDRAKAGAAQMVKEQLANTVCAIRYEGNDASIAQEPTAANPRVFARVCGVLESLRIEEIASSSKVLARAVAADLSEFAFRKLQSHFNDGLARPLLQSLKSMLLGYLEGKSVSTERDFQTMLLRLGRVTVDATPVAVTSTDKFQEREWRCGIGVGFAVLRECLRRDSCSAEQLQASLTQELRDPSPECKGLTDRLDNEWRDLASILARAIDVFRPPPGVGASQTARTATNVVLDVLGRLPSAKQGEVDKIRGLINAVFEKDYVAGIVSVSGLLVDTIEEHCASIIDGGKSKCWGVTSDQVKKGLALLNGFVSYASTYDDAPRPGEEAKTQAEREKLRHDERKKAMEGLIDSATDRSNRAGRWVFSVGVGVGLTTGRVPKLSSSFGDDHTWVPSLTLPLGFAYQKLPGSTFPFGLHFNAMVLDLGQYASVSKDANNVSDPSIGTAAALGLQAGVLIGKPTFSGLLALDFGYAPALKFPDSGKVGYWRLGVMAGTYVPFFDFN